jgi:NADH:ubiquinone oxidoreductase subunit E
MVANRERIREILETQRGKTITVLSSLITVQNALGYLPEESISTVAEFTGASINEVYGVATFYTHFRFTPPPRNTVEVCWGPSCHLGGAPKVLESFQEIERQGLVVVRRNSCLGACSQGPVASLNEQLMGRLTPDAVKALGTQLQKGHIHAHL